MIKNRNCDFTPAFEVPSLTSDPAAARNLVAGMMYYKAGSTKKIRFWNGTAWANIEGAGGGASAWVDLTDTAGSITAKSIVRSNAAGDALEFVAVVDGKILVGNASDIPTAVTPSGDVAMSNAGLFTVTDLTITSEAAGDILYFDGTNWIRLAKDTGKYLKSGASAVTWENVSVAVADKLSDTFEIEGGASYDITVDITTQTASAPTVTLPDLGGVAQEWVFTKVAQTLEGKTLTAPKFADTGYIADSNGNELLMFGVTGSATTYLKIINAINAGGVTVASAGGAAAEDLLLVAKGTGVVKADGVEIVTLSGSQILTNKTLTSPTLTTPKFVNTGYIADSNGNELIMFGVTGSATTYLKVTNAINAGGVTVEAAGGSTNENLLLVSKGSGVVKADGVEIVTLTDTQILTNKRLTSPKINEDVAVTSTATELNILDGVLADATELNILNGALLSTAELNILNGATVTYDELNLIDGSIAGTAVASKALVLGANKNIDTIVIADGGLMLGAGAGTSVTSTAAEINYLDTSSPGVAVASKALVLGANKNVDELHIGEGKLYLGAVAGTAVSSTAVELNYLDTSSPGVAVASKALVLGTNKNVDELHIAEGKLYLGAAAGTAVSSTAVELNYLDGSSVGVAVVSKALVLGANKNVDTIVIADSGLMLGAGAGTAVDATAVELNTKTLIAEIEDISNGDVAYVVSPYAGTLSKVYTVIHGAITVASETLTANVNGGANVTATITIDQASSAAGIVDSCDPGDNKTVAVGNYIKLTSAGNSTGPCKATVMFVITL